MNVTTTSTTGSLDIKDFLKGLLIAVGTPVITTLITSLKAGQLNFNWTAIGIIALSALLTYLLKNFFTPGTIVIEAPKPVVEQVKDGDAVASVTTINKDGSRTTV